MVKKYTRNRKYSRRSRTRRQYQGGDQAELLRFRYTKDPKRIAWIEALYPYSSQIASIPGLIPWKEYSYDGLARMTQWIPDGKSKGIEIDMKVEAKAGKVPYVIGGGAACELYNAKFKKLGGPDLHETADPTADVDIFLEELSIGLPLLSKEKRYRILKRDRHTNTLYPLYDQYTRWIIEHVVNILRPIAAQMPSPPFVAPTEESISKLVKLENVDIQTRVGNILILREIPAKGLSDYIKIQCITTVQTKEGLQITDHFCELLFNDVEEEIPYNVVINPLLRSDGIPNPLVSSIYALEGIPGISVPSLFVYQLPIFMLEQISSFRDRKRSQKLKLKAQNHYGRIAFLSKLGLFLQTTKYTIGMDDAWDFTKSGIDEMRKHLGEFADI